MVRLRMMNMRQLSKILSEYGNDIYQRMYTLLRKNSILLATHTKTSRLTGGTTSRKLRVRSGKLRASTRPIKPMKMPGRIVAGIKIGTAYGRVHFGPPGQVTTITPNPPRQYLAIPLSAAKTRAGVARGRPLDKGVFGETFIAKSKKGNLIIFGKGVAQKGGHAGETRGKLKPLFVLKKSVDVKARIDPLGLVRWIRKHIVGDMRNEVVRAARMRRAKEGKGA